MLANEQLRTAMHRIYLLNEMLRAEEVDLMRKSETIGFQVKCTANLINRFIDNSQMDDCGENRITRMQWWIIDYVYDHGDSLVFQRDIEKEFSIRRSTATELLKLMEKNGLLIRESVPNDLRLKKLTLTEKSLNVYKKMKLRVEQIEAAMSEGITEEEKKIFFMVMEKIRENIIKNENV